MSEPKKYKNILSYFKPLKEKNNGSSVNENISSFFKPLKQVKIEKVIDVRGINVSEIENFKVSSPLKERKVVSSPLKSSNDMHLRNNFPENNARSPPKPDKVNNLQKSPKKIDSPWSSSDEYEVHPFISNVHEISSSSDDEPEFSLKHLPSAEMEAEAQQLIPNESSLPEKFNMIGNNDGENSQSDPTLPEVNPSATSVPEYQPGTPFYRTHYSPTSPARYSPTSPARYSPTSPARCSPTSPARCSPTSPAHFSLTSPAHFSLTTLPAGPTSRAPTPLPDYSPTSRAPTPLPDYSPTSRALTPLPDYSQTSRAPTLPDYSPTSPAYYSPTTPPRYRPPSPVHDNDSIIMLTPPRKDFETIDVPSSPEASTVIDVSTTDETDSSIRLIKSPEDIQVLYSQKKDEPIMASSQKIVVNPQSLLSREEADYFASQRNEMDSSYPFYGGSDPLISTFQRLNYQDPFFPRRRERRRKPKRAPKRRGAMGEGPSLYNQPDTSPQVADDEVEEEELRQAETYADYMPSKLNIGLRHPDPVVETSSLSSVQPPDIHYKLGLPEEVIDKGQLSALQLEAITYACQKHESILSNGQRAGFLIGDGAGVGKGRTLAGVICENYLLGRKQAIWFSVSSDLKYDAERDLKDIGASKIPVYSLNKFKYAKISSSTNGSVRKGIVFSTYSALIGETHKGGKYSSRIQQLLDWCGEDFDGCIVFDECHKAKNLCPSKSSKPTKTGLRVLELQNKLPRARVVYASATGASEPKNMAYMTRLGLWGAGTPFHEFKDFITVIEKRGVGAMELVAMDMKLRGIYIARQLSFAGVTFKVEKIKLTDEFEKMYNDSVDLWVDARVKFERAASLLTNVMETKKKNMMWAQFWAAHQRFFKYLCIASKVRHVVQLARECVKMGKCVVIGLQSTGEARTLEQLEECGGELTDFVSTAKAVFQSLIEKQFPSPDGKRTKAGSSVASLKSDYSNSNSSSPTPVSNGNKRALRNIKPAAKKVKTFIDDEADVDFKSASKKVKDEDFEMPNSDESTSSDLTDLENDNPFGKGSDSDDPWVTKKEKKPKRKRVNKKPDIKMQELPNILASANSYEAQQIDMMRDSLLQKLEKFGDKLPPNTLDQLIDELGGPEEVAEMTGRKGRVVNNDGDMKYEQRSEVDTPLEMLNMLEKQRFMDGEKMMAIISEAASSGISLQSDRRVKNQAQRVHITLELAWSADRAIQQFGRTHRSNQVNAPEYIFIISDLAGEHRFASIVAKRLESLGALTHGDRRATESKDLSQFNIDTKYGRNALEATMKAVMVTRTPLVPIPRDYLGDFFFDIRRALVGVALIGESAINGHQTLNKDHNNMGKVLNRILGFPVDLQNRFFKYLMDTLDAVVAESKRSGHYDMGILDLGGGDDLIKKVQTEQFTEAHSTGVAQTELHTVMVERGISWDAIINKWTTCNDKDEGFYMADHGYSSKKAVALVIADNSRTKQGRAKLYRLYRPNTGLQAKSETLEEIMGRYWKVAADKAEKYWRDNYDGSERQCSHMYWYGTCKKKVLGVLCEVGLRQRQYFILSGSVLSVWTKVEGVLATYYTSRTKRLQVVRLKMGEDSRIIGCLIPRNVVEHLRDVLNGKEIVNSYSDDDVEMW